MALAVGIGYLVLTKDQKDKLDILIEPARIRFNGHFSDLNSRFTL